MTPSQEFPALTGKGLPELARQVRAQPRELLWRRLLVDAAWLNPASVRYRKLIVESAVTLFEADVDAPTWGDSSQIFRDWRWKDAERIADALSANSGTSPKTLVCEFLASIAEVTDDPRACLKRARRELDRIPPDSTHPEDFASLQGSVLIRQDESEFLRRFDSIVEGLRQGPFSGKSLCLWLLFDPRRVGTESRTRVRAALLATPMQNRDDNAEIDLAAVEGLRALKAKNHAGVAEALARMREFSVGAFFPSRQVRALVEPLLRRRLLVAECRELLEELSHKEHAEDLLPLLARARRIK